MKTNTFVKRENLRKERNNDVLRRMKNGESLTSFNSYASWYPPRPIIDKDDEAISKLYGEAARSRLSKTNNDSEAGKLNPDFKPLRLA